MKDACYSISEASEILEYPSHVLRFYEKEFDIEIPRNKSNHRYYTIKEIEIFQYIKQLHDKGFNNNQIKLILDSPEVETVSFDPNLTLVKNDVNEENEENEVTDISLFFKDFNEMIQNNFNQINKNIESLHDEIAAIKKEISSQEDDVLLTENAKLKMRLKEKSYELIEWKEKYKKANNQKSFLNRLFKK